MHLLYNIASSKFEMVDKSFFAKELLLKSIKENLTQARNRMRLVTNKKRQDKEIQVWDMVYVKL